MRARRRSPAASSAVSSLASATQYYYNFYATNLYGDNWGSPSTLFSTVGGAAVDNDGGATAITTTGAVLRGTVTSGNPTPDTYICWGDNGPAVDSTGAWDTVVSMGLQDAAFQTNDYGTNFVLGQTYETGSMFYGHVGYLLPGQTGSTKIQPYISYNNRSIDAIDNSASRFGLGGNLYFSGHNSKLSLEYARQQYNDLDARNIITVQGMIYL